MYHEEGRLVPKAGGFEHQYVLKDHLGNTRVMFADLDNNGSVAASEIVQQNHYYPFGLAHETTTQTGKNPYLYNGKELNEDLGLNLYDYGARWYDATIARWQAVDALADEPEQIDKSNYAYAWNNPLGLNDPDGNCPNCITAGLGFLIGAGVEFGGQMLSGKSLDEIDWADVAVEGVKGGLLGSGVGMGGAVLLEGGSLGIKASFDVTVEGGNKNLFNGGKSTKEVAVDGILDMTTGIAGNVVGKKVSNFTQNSLNKSEKVADKAAKDLTKANNKYNKATDGGKNLITTNGQKAAAKKETSEGKVNIARSNVVKNRVINSTTKGVPGKVVNEVAQNKSSDNIKNKLISK